ncbi:SH3 domain-containing protein [Actinomycetospora endophytica]|uniref:SH3 domain-containing protein n=1 Tax=Actinomycetospora endophytica TaxID=2291215 RepID=A0ABS8PF91_9PSEU|nr:SH3 domain-containing protein [Actinomycetospora endophytica]MCD2196091.1 SH3 domain-containing protein [Actinomycetospora endophytica]
MRDDRRRRRVVLAVSGCALGLLLAGCGKTTVSGVHVRASPSTSSTVTGTLGPQGTGVDVRCWTRGEAVHGHTVWYRINQPAGGYVTSYYVANSDRSMQATPTC